MPFFRFDGLNVYYEVRGEGKPLLLLHGNSVSSTLFKHIAPMYEKHFKVIMFDYPGTGKSDRVARFRDDYWRYNAECAYALMDFLGFSQFQAIGTSGGGLAGLNMATQQPGRITKLIPDSFLGDYLTAEEAESIVSRRTQMKKNQMSRLYWKAHIGDDWEDIVDKDMDLMLRVGRNNLKIIYGNYRDIESEVLGVATYTDELVPNTPGRVREVCDKIPNAKTKFFNFGRHTFMITARIEFFELSMDFLDK
jgi:valacyclovir hydrolase